MGDYRVLVTGSRDWADQIAVRNTLTGLLREHGHLTIVHGGCPSGADALAALYAANTYRHVTAEPHPADWAAYGKRAGFIRNAEMVALGADVCVAFVMLCAKPGCHKGKPHGSHGATHCAGLAEKAGIPVRRVTCG